MLSLAFYFQHSLTRAQRRGFSELQKPCYEGRGREGHGSKWEIGKALKHMDL